VQARRQRAYPVSGCPPCRPADSMPTLCLGARRAGPPTACLPCVWAHNCVHAGSMQTCWSASVVTNSVPVLALATCAGRDSPRPSRRADVAGRGDRAGVHRLAGPGGLRGVPAAPAQRDAPGDPRHHGPGAWPRAPRVALPWWPRRRWQRVAAPASVSSVSRRANHALNT